MGLLKTGLKAAVAVKTAHVVHDRIQQRQHAEWAAQGHPAAPPPAPATPAAASDDMSSKLALLTQLGELRASGVLTEAEFEAQKARILNG